ncbi:Metallo-hydrolase/oxidoreductase [Laetiporus sulphureus 93-53]|uniref:Metallo-hydrolase/oxidoreductase n=1 Tax=Laetiporus sulphureus 93-53 TaxID=1314785 RepID=A0A165DCT4_9APHY|nr:Metallo-hydrolase/oxidoreductase [Laetiporus sulphureus 93-53]KZT04581.1 Metallo-hydrolase/oxidoreductase [Laetiporus sulphureus 93-53]
MAPLRTVDKFVVTFLVDNCIEWMTKLPPGFTHEMRTHLTEHNPPIDELTGIPFVDFENYCCGAHGFSALIETQIEGEKSHYTLFDTGPESRSIARNIAAMHVPTHRIDRIILSHWHSDHSGGMLSFLRIRAEDPASASAPPCVVDLHPSRPIARGMAPQPQGIVIGRHPPDPTFEQLREAGAVVETHKEGHAVADGTVWVSGEIPRVTEFEGGLPGGVRWVEKEGKGEWVKEDHLMDERYAAVDVAGKGLILFSACSHAGIVNVVKDAVMTFARPVYMIIGGLHLAGTDLTPRIEPTVKFLSKQLRPAPAYVLPMHCSGFVAKIALEAALGEGCVPAGVGHKVEVAGDREAEKKMFPPSIDSD